MIKFSATNALVHSVTPVIEIEYRSGGQPFCKRELIIDDSWDKDGKHYANFVSIEFTGDKMAQLDSVYPGMRVNVDGLLSGREYNNRIYNSVRGQSVSPYQAQQQSAPHAYRLSSATAVSAGSRLSSSSHAWWLSSTACRSCLSTATSTVCTTTRAGGRARGGSGTAAIQSTILAGCE